ncbi:uncharacterized protein DS421_12g375150 [Arachis hypogaea]|nr:uncharacterized protein DS421_12g375150 [Arachis hypogaea]
MVDPNQTCALYCNCMGTMGPTRRTSCLFAILHHSYIITLSSYSHSSNHLQCQ